MNKSLKGIYNNDFNKTTNQYYTAYTAKLNLNRFNDEINQDATQCINASLLTPKIITSNDLNKSSNALKSVWNTSVNSVQNKL